MIFSYQPIRNRDKADAADCCTSEKRALERMGNVRDAQERWLHNVGDTECKGSGYINTVHAFAATNIHGPNVEKPITAREEYVQESDV